MDSLLNLVGAFFNLVGVGVGRIYMAIALGILFMFGFWFQVFRLNLWATPGMWIGAAFCWFGLWLGAVLFDTGKPAKAISFLCGVCLIGISIARMAPNTTAGGKTVLTYEDKKNLQLAEETVQEVPSRVRCDLGNFSQLVFFKTDGNTGQRKNKLWYTESEGRIECYDRAGFDPVFGKELKDVDESIVRRIAQQPAPVSPQPTPTAAPVQLAENPAPPAQLYSEEPPRPATRLTLTPTLALTPPLTLAPEPPPTQRQPSEYSVMPGESLTVSLTEPLDLGEHGENYQFSGLLMSDVVSSDGVVLAKSGTPAGLFINYVQAEPDNSALVNFAVVFLTTPSGKLLPVNTQQDQQIVVRSVKTGLKKNGLRGALLGAAVGGITGAIVDGRRGAARGGAAGTIVGAGTGVALTKGQYILAPCQIRMSFTRHWVVPAKLTEASR